MKLWFAVSSVVFLGVATMAATPEELVAGKKVYTGKCARCHKMYDPTKYDDRAWDSWMEKMKLKTKLTEVQYRHLTQYVATLRPRN